MIKNKVTKILISAGIASSIICISPAIISHAENLNHIQHSTISANELTTTTSHSNKNVKNKITIIKVYATLDGKPINGIKFNIGVPNGCLLKTEYTAVTGKYNTIEVPSQSNTQYEYEITNTPQGYMTSSKPEEITEKDGIKTITFSVNFHKPYTGKVTVECKDMATGKILNSKVYTGYLITGLMLQPPTIPEGYKVDSVTDNGKVLKSYPFTYSSSVPTFLGPNGQPLKNIEWGYMSTPQVISYNVVLKKVDTNITYKDGNKIIKTTKDTVNYGTKLDDNVINIPKGYVVNNINENGTNIGDNLNYKLTKTNNNIIVSLNKASYPVTVNYICNGKVISKTTTELPYESELTNKLLNIASPYSIDYITTNGGTPKEEISGNVKLNSNIINVYLIDNSASITYSATCGTTNVSGVELEITTNSGKTYTVTTGEGTVLHLPDGSYQSVQVIKVPKGYQANCGIAIDNIFSANGNLSINVPLEKLYKTSITLKVMDTSGNILSDNTSSGFVGQVYVPENYIKNGYNLISMTENGKTIPNLPLYFGNKNETIIINVINTNPPTATHKDIKPDEHHNDLKPVVKPTVKPDAHHSDSKPVVKQIVKPNEHHTDSKPVVNPTVKSDEHHNDSKPAVKPTVKSNFKALNETGMVDFADGPFTYTTREPNWNNDGNGKLYNNTVVKIIGESNGWYKLSTSYGDAWVPQSRIKIISKDSHTPSTGIIDFKGGNFTYMTRNPNWNNDGVGSISNGTEVKIISEYDGWYNIQYGPQESDTAWIPMDRVNTNGLNASKLNGIVDFNVGNFTYVTKNPNWNNDGLGSLVNGSEVYIVGSYNGWYKIEYGTSYAWIPMSRVNTKGYVSMNKAGVVKFSGDSFSYVTQNPNWNNDGVGSINNGTEVTVLASYNGWYKIEYADGVAWIPQSRINTNVPQSIATGVIDFKGGYTYVTKNPNWNNDGLGALSNGIQVNIFQKKDGWYQISFDGRKAWVPMDRIRVQSNA